MWNALERRVHAILQQDEDGARALPGSMLHDLRQSLFLGRSEADARLQLVRNRYPQLASLLYGESLFFEETSEGSVGSATGFLDALELSEFWK
jgi:hypothetical protein